MLAGTVYPGKGDDARSSMMSTHFPSAILRCIAGAAGMLAVLAAFDAPAQGQWGQWGADFDEGKKPWKEIEAKIPAYPKPENLLPFEAVKTSGHRYFIDAQSLSLGEDGVVRYVLVIQTAGGATNVTFEGMRCDMRQQKYYAIGQKNGGWTRARDPQWRRIAGYGQSRHGTLYDEYFCADNKLPATPRQIIHMLRYRGSPTSD